MRRRQLASLVLLLAACGPATASPTPSAVVSNQHLPCKLAFGINGGLSGFVAYPGGDFTPDPSSDLTHSPYRGANASVIGYGPAYDAAMRRWLPVPRALVSPDGGTYAYGELLYPPAPPSPASGPRMVAPAGTRIHIVDVASAADRVVLDSHEFWTAVAYSGNHVYLIHGCPECGSGDGGLWTVDASSGVIEQVAAADASTQYMWTVVGTAAAWATDPHGGLARLDLATSTVSVWSGVASKMLRPIGLDSRGLPIAEGEANYSIAGSFRGGAWLVRGPQDAVQIAPGDLFVDEAVSDSHGVWLLSFNDIYLWNAGSGLDRVGAVPASTSAKSLAGPCLS